ncbi:MAG: DegV family protein [Anaerolineae bacterium]|nr:DegV family protein [Anaerolineae bacterium]
MSKVAIVTDSSAYLPEEIIASYPIHVIPLTLNWDGKDYRDGVDIKAVEFYTRLATSNSIPTTSQIPVFEYEKMFSRLLDEDYDILTLPISSGISGTLQSALQAKELFKCAPIEVIDSKLVSMALGFQVLAAARAAVEGASLEECLAVAREAYGKIGVYFTVDTLKYLHQGGRINSAKHLVGTALNIKPVLEIRDGKIELVSSVVSSRKAIERMIKLVEEGINGREPVRISVFHANVPEQARELQDRLMEQFNAVEGILSEVSPVVGSHTGPGTLSIAYMAG